MIIGFFTAIGYFNDMHSKEISHMAISETIQAAIIQANATYYASIIGAIGIALGVLCSWWTALHLQKRARLADLRKTIYLELVGFYSLMVNGFSTFLMDPHKNWPIQFDRITDFCISLAKAAFVCESSTKAALYDFLDFYNDGLTNLIPSVNEIIEFSEELESLQIKHKQVMDKIEIATKYIDSLKMNNPIDSRIHFIFKQINDHLSNGEKILELITQAEDKLNTKKAAIYIEIRNFMVSINKQVIPITHLFREELGAKTDIELDRKLHEIVMEKNLK